MTTTRKESSMETLDVLIAARAEVEAGWCKKVAVDHHGNVCAVGAIETASRRAEGHAHVRDWRRRHPSCAHRPSGRAARLGAERSPWFNDDPQTTKADVIALFDRAIAAEAVKVTADPAHTYTVAA
jgi:sugar phosphate isomerase/epimerase